VKDLVDKLLAALPLYGRQMVALLLGPKTAILNQDLESESALQQAMTFLAVSFGIAYIAQIPFLPSGQNAELIFGVLAVQSALAFSFNIVMLILAWKIVGGKLAWRKVIAATCYFSGVSTILFTAFYLIAAGAFKTLDPEGYQQFMSGVVTDPGDLLKSGGLQAFVVLFGVAFLATYAWIFSVWGAYRQLMQLSKLRSGIALLLFTAFSPLLLLVQVLMAATIALSRPPPVPHDLIGQWQIIGRTQANGIASADILMFTFAAPPYKILPAGNYAMSEARGSTNGKCMVTDQRAEYGLIVVKGSTMVLTPTKRTDSAKNECTGKSWEVPTNLGKAEYQYKINPGPTGWTLCLSNRFGQICLTPKGPS
jgi:hypothetical protein